MADSRYTARGHKLRFAPNFQRIATQNGKADSDGAHPFFRLPIRWKEKRSLCPLAVKLMATFDVWSLNFEV